MKPGTRVSWIFYWASFWPTYSPYLSPSPQTQQVAGITLSNPLPFMFILASSVCHYSPRHTWAPQVWLEDKVKPLMATGSSNNGISKSNNNDNQQPAQCPYFKVISPIPSTHFCSFSPHPPISLCLCLCLSLSLPPPRCLIKTNPANKRLHTSQNF